MAVSRKNCNEEESAVDQASQTDLTPKEISVEDDKSASQSSGLEKPQVYGPKSQALFDLINNRTSTLNEALSILLKRVQCLQKLKAELDGSSGSKRRSDDVQIRVDWEIRRTSDEMTSMLKELNAGAVNQASQMDLTPKDISVENDKSAFQSSGLQQQVCGPRSQAVVDSINSKNTILNKALAILLQRVQCLKKLNSELDGSSGSDSRCEDLQTRVDWEIKRATGEVTSMLKDFNPDTTTVTSSGDDKRKAPSDNKARSERLGKVPAEEESDKDSTLGEEVDVILDYSFSSDSSPSPIRDSPGGSSGDVEQKNKKQRKDRTLYWNYILTTYFSTLKARRWILVKTGEFHGILVKVYEFDKSTAWEKYKRWTVPTLFDRILGPMNTWGTQHQLCRSLNYLHDQEIYRKSIKKVLAYLHSSLYQGFEERILCRLSNEFEADVWDWILCNYMTNVEMYVVAQAKIRGRLSPNLDYATFPAFVDRRQYYTRRKNKDADSAFLYECYAFFGEHVHIQREVLSADFQEMFAQPKASLKDLEMEYFQRVLGLVNKMIVF